MKRSMISRSGGLGVFYPFWDNAAPICEANNECKVSAQVVDDFGTPIPGASVYPTNNVTKGIATDFDGNFTLSKPKNDTITVSSMGFKTRIVEANTVPKKIILMQADNALEEVVVVGEKKKVPVNKTKMFGYGLLGFLLVFAALGSNNEKKKEGKNKVKAKV